MCVCESSSPHVIAAVIDPHHPDFGLHLDFNKCGPLKKGGWGVITTLPLFSHALERNDGYVTYKRGGINTTARTTRLVDFAKPIDTPPREEVGERPHHRPLERHGGTAPPPNPTTKKTSEAATTIIAIADTKTDECEETAGAAAVILLFVADRTVVGR